MPAAGSRKSVCMESPARRSCRRALKLRRLTLRLSGAPRCQFFTRLANSTATTTSTSGMTV